MKAFAKVTAAAMFVLAAGTVPALADACSGRSHDTGTALGAAGGAAIGGLATKSIGGAIVGGVAGGFAGNAIARSEDCRNHEARGARHDRRSFRDSYNSDHRYRRRYR